MSVLKIKDPTTGDWLEIQTIKGDTGPQGPKGDKGDPGQNGTATDAQVAAWLNEHPEATTTVDYRVNTKTFSTVAQMVQDTTLENGDFAKTNGYHVFNDGGGADYKITNSALLVSDGGSVIALSNGLKAELIVDCELNIKQFGAKGDAQNDDTNAIQTAIDFCFANGIDLKIPSSANYYKTTKPLLLVASPVDGYIGDNYWNGNGTRLFGDYKARCRITKVGDSTLADSPIDAIKNINATLICYQSGNTGICIDGVTLQNISADNSGQTTEGSLSLWTNVSRSKYANINSYAYHGIFARSFSSLWENIEFNAVETALNIENGTSNTFRFLYAHGVKNPYSIRSAYSTAMNCASDGCTGSIYSLSGIGLKLLNCGCESPKAQYIIKQLSDFFSVTVDGMMIDRQTGDDEEELAVEDCAMVLVSAEGSIKLRDVSIVERKEITGTSFIFKLPSNGIRFSTAVENLMYNKNFIGNNNKRMKMWNNYATEGFTHHSIKSGSVNIDYQLIGEGQIVPHIGSVIGAQSGTDNMNPITSFDDLPISKAIFFDCEGRYDISNGNTMQYIANAQLGDIHIFNDPKANGCLGLVTTSVTNGQLYSLTPIPLILAGPTENRPTKRYNGTFYFDTTLRKPVWWSDDAWAWVDATGQVAT